jgi:hypothetical protein
MDDSRARTRFRGDPAGAWIALRDPVKSDFLALTSAIAISCVAHLAHADAELRIETIEDHSWPASVASLQRDLKSEGRIVHVAVKETDGTRVKCGTYDIELDHAASEAFQIGICDTWTDATPLKLVHRAALFDHGEVVSRPRAPRIVARRTQSGEAAGGAKPAAESAVDCTVNVRPFIRDLENGGRVQLSPGRYGLRTKNADVRVLESGDGWTFVAPRGTSRTAEYFVVDQQSGEVVLNDKVTMNCSVQTSAGSGGPPPETRESQDGFRTKAYTPGPEETDHARPSEEPDRPREHAGLPWNGHATTFNLGVGTAIMQPESVRFANDAGRADAESLGLHSAGGVSVLVGVGYERPGLYGSIGASIAATTFGHRTLWNFGATSVVAPALHLGDTALYLGPAVNVGTYQASAESTESLAYGSTVQFTLGGAAGARFHIRDESTGKLDYVLGFELVAPVAGPAPWFLMAQLALGSGK